MLPNPAESSQAKDRQWIAWLIAVALIVAGTLLGTQFPELPPTPDDGSDADDGAADGGTSRGHTGLTGLEVISPTEQPTGTPAVIVDSSGVSNLFEVRDAATPVFAVRNGGTLLGVLGYGTAGQKVVCSSTTITGTGAIAHTLATPAYVVGTIGEDLTGKSARLSFTNASATVTFKVWNTALTPAASDEGIDVNWCAVGTP